MKSVFSHPLIAREGWLLLGISFISSAVLFFFFGFLTSLPAWVFSVFALQFFRDPIRKTHSFPGEVVSAADGRVVAVMPCSDPLFERPAIKVSVFMSIFDVHSNRCPVNARVLSLRYSPGRFLQAHLDKASAENENNAMGLELATGEKITVVQIAGLLARRILCYAKVGEQLVAGQRYGFIRFGSRVDIYLPIHARIKIALGEKVYAGETVIADLTEK